MITIIALVGTTGALAPPSATFTWSPTFTDVLLKESLGGVLVMDLDTYAHLPVDLNLAHQRILVLDPTRQGKLPNAEVFGNIDVLFDYTQYSLQTRITVIGTLARTLLPKAQRLILGIAAEQTNPAALAHEQFPVINDVQWLRTNTWFTDTTRVPMIHESISRFQ
jgi:hypothetical protein